MSERRSQMLFGTVVGGGAALALGQYDGPGWWLKALLAVVLAAYLIRRFDQDAG